MTIEHRLREANSIRYNKVGPNTNVKRTHNVVEKSKRNDDISLLETTSVLTLDVLTMPEQRVKQNVEEHVFSEVMDTIKLEPNS